MIKRATERRLDAVNAHMSTAPMNEASLNDAYERFLETGALPDQRRCAWVVLDRALRARRGCRPARRRAGIRVPPREQVFREAVHDFEPARKPPAC